MPLFRSSPFEDLVVQATSEKNVADDWSLILDICDKAVNYEEGPKLILQAITKRLYNNVPRVVVQALLLLDACVKNCGKRFLLEVSSHNFVAELQKLLTKIHPGTVEKLKGLIKKWAEQDFKDDSQLGLIPSLYYKLQSEGVQFPEEKPVKATQALCTNPDAVSSQEEEEDIVKALALSLKDAPQDNYSSYSTSNMEDSSKPAKVELLKARALYDFEAVEENELTIKAGEVVVVIDKSNESWWKGTNQRGEGYFPVSFITEDLEAPVEVLHESAKVEEELSEVPEEKVEKPPVIDDQKIELALRLLNETDPTDECPDDESLLGVERECYAMAPLIEEMLHTVDKKCTVLNSLNEEIMKAMQTFHKLTRDTMTPSQYHYYYTTSLDSAVTSQQMQDSAAMHQHYQNAGTVPNTAARHVPTQDSGPYVLPGYFPNLTNLSSTQIRENVAVLAHSTPVYPPHYNTLPHKMPTVNVRVPFPNVVPYGPMPPSQSIVRTSILPAGNGECRAVVSTSCPNKEGQLSHQSIPSSQMYPNVPQHDPASTGERHTFYDGAGTSEGESLPAEVRTSTELSSSGQQPHNCIMSQEIPVHDAITISATNQVPSGPSNSNTIITNAPIASNSVATPQ